MYLKLDYKMAIEISVNCKIVCEISTIHLYVQCTVAHDLAPKVYEMT